MKIWFSRCKLWQLHVVRISFMLFQSNWIGSAGMRNNIGKMNGTVSSHCEIVAVCVISVMLHFDLDSIFLAKLQFRLHYAFDSFFSLLHWNYGFRHTVEKYLEMEKERSFALMNKEKKTECYRKKGRKKRRIDNTEWLREKNTDEKKTAQINAHKQQQRQQQQRHSKPV